MCAHTIGFRFKSPWLESLSDVSVSDDENIVAGGDHNASSTTTFVAPSVTIDQFSRLSHRKELYLALFKPKNTSRWSGNLKKYRLTGSPATVKDATGNAAVDVATGTFNPTSNLISQGNRIVPGNITPEMIGASSTGEGNIFIDWLTGFDVFDENEDGSVIDTRNPIGDPLHSSPVEVAYGFEVPRELMPNVAELVANQPLSSSTSRVYGLDGDLTLRTTDHNNNGLIETDGAVEDEAYLYMGMRRGGKNYYALDVSEKSQPKFLWSIIGGEDDYVELGQSWSKPEVARIKVGDEIKDVLVFGGGYDPLQDDYDERTTDTIGRAIYIVDADTGELIWSGGNPENQPAGNNHKSLPDMKYSIPSDLAIVPDMQTGLLSQLYVGDMGGQLWRFDVNNGNSVADLVDGGVIADLTDDTSTDARRFYARPDLSLSRANNGELLVNIAIGSGYRAHPLDESTRDIFAVYQYPFNGYDTYQKATINELFDTTENLIVEGATADVISDAEAALEAAKGWYITFEDSIGMSYRYALNLDNGSPYVEEGETSSRYNRRSAIPGEGIASPITTIFVENDGSVTPTDVSGVNTLHEWDDIDMVQRWFWAENPQDGN